MAFHNVPPNGFPDLPDVEELEAVQKDVTTLKTTTAEQGAAITNLNSTKANKTDIATEFSDLTNYYAGDLVYYDGALYEFQVDHTAGAWETSEVIQKDLSDIVTTLKSGLTSLNSKRIELETFNTGTNASTLSFAGTAHCRRANMVLLLSTQGLAVPPIVVCFTGQSQGYETILGVYVSANDVGVTASGSNISIPAELSFYGTHTIVKLYPDDDITITVNQ